MSWSSVALYTLTGTLTSPKAIEPFQMERMQSVCPPARLLTRADTKAPISARKRGLLRLLAGGSGTGAGDSQRRRQAACLKRGRQRVQPDPTQGGSLAAAQQALFPQRVEQSDHERVAGAHRVHHLNRPGAHPRLAGLAKRQRAV